MPHSKDMELYHYGVPKKSGRYPWGSGKRPFQGDNVLVGKSKNKAPKAPQDVAFDHYKNSIGPAAKKVVSDYSDIKTKKELNERLTELYKESKEMSDEDLRKVINRNRLEKEFRDTVISNEDYIKESKTYSDVVLDAVEALGSVAIAVMAVKAAMK